MLDSTIRRAVAQPVPVPVKPGRADPVELDQPLLEAVLVRSVGRPHLVGRGVERDDGLGPSPASAGAHLNELLEGGPSRLVGGELAPHGEPGRLDQVGEGDCCGRFVTDVAGWRAKLESTQGTVSGVGKPIERGDGAERDALLGHPGIDQRVSKCIWKCVGQKRGQPVVGPLREFGETVWLGSQRHHERGKLDAFSDPLGSEGEDQHSTHRVRSDGADAAIPRPHLDDIDRLVAHRVSSTRRRTRGAVVVCASRVRASRRCNGLNVAGGGASCSSQFSAPRA